MSPESSFCAACYAEAGEPCAWDCIGLASQIDALEAQCESGASAPGDEAQRGSALTANHDAPGAEVTDAHCLVCHAARLQDSRHAEGLIGRWMTVQASKDYARIYFRHELDAPSQ